MKALKIALVILGVLLALMGLIWFLQGINILGGSGMSGKLRWAVNGGIAIVVGILLILGTKLIGRKKPGSEINLMLTVMTVVGVLAVFMGIIWFLQGINILGGSGMSGKLQWAINGGVAIVVGILLILGAGMIGLKKKADIHLIMTIIIVIGVMLALMGLRWFLQGINVFPGSGMSGKIQWAINGGIALVVGVLLVPVSGMVERIGKK